MATKTWIGGGTNLWSTGANWSGGTIPAAGDDVEFSNNVSCVVDVATANLLSIKFKVGATNWTGTLTGTFALNVAGAITFPDSGGSSTQFSGYTGTLTLLGTATAITYSVAINGYALGCPITVNATNAATVYDFTTYLLTTGIFTLTKGGVKFSATSPYGATVLRFLSNNSNTRSVDGTSIEITSTSSSSLLDISTATGLTWSATTSVYITSSVSGVSRYINGNTTTTLPNVYFNVTSSAQIGFLTATKVGSIYAGPNFSGILYLTTGCLITNIYMGTSTCDISGSGVVDIYGDVVLSTALTGSSMTISGLFRYPTNGAVISKFTSNGVITNVSFTINGGHLQFLDEFGSQVSTNSTLAVFTVNSGTLEFKENAAIYYITMSGGNLITYYGKTLRHYDNGTGILAITGANVTLNCKFRGGGINVSSGRTLICKDSVRWSQSLTVNGTLTLEKGTYSVGENSNITVSSTGIFNVGKANQTPTWLASTYYSLGDVVAPSVSTGYYYEATSAGTSASNQPSSLNMPPNPWPTVLGNTIVDGGVTWTCKYNVWVSPTTADTVGDLRCQNLTQTGGTVRIYNNVNTHRDITISGGPTTVFITYAGKLMNSLPTASSVGRITVSGSGTSLTISANVSNGEGVTVTSGGSLLITGRVDNAGTYPGVGQMVLGVLSSLTFTPPLAYPNVVASSNGTLYGTLQINGNLVYTGSAVFAMPATSVVTRANSTAYTLGTIRVSTTGNGFIYEVTTAGTSGSSEPVVMTDGSAGPGSTIPDGTGTLVWTCRQPSVTITGNISVYSISILKGGNNFTTFLGKTITNNSAGTFINNTGTGALSNLTIKANVLAAAFTNTSGNITFGDPDDVAPGRYVVFASTLTHTIGTVIFNYELNPSTQIAETAVNGIYTLTEGTVEFNNNASLLRFRSSTINARTVKIAPGKILRLNGILGSGNAVILGSAWYTYNNSSLTVDALGSTIMLTGADNTGSFGTLFNGGVNLVPNVDVNNRVTGYNVQYPNIRFGTLQFKRANNSTATNYVLGSNIFQSILDGDPTTSTIKAHTIRFEVGTNRVQAVEDFSIKGKVGDKITINSCTYDQNDLIGTSTNLHYLCKTTGFTNQANTIPDPNYSNTTTNEIEVENTTIAHSAVTPKAGFPGDPDIWIARSSTDDGTAVLNSGWKFLNQRYWVGGSGDWDGNTATTGNKWSATKGGPGGALPPTTNDDVYFDNSPAPTYNTTVNTSYTLGTIRTPPTANGYYYEVTTAGTSSGSGPATWNTPENSTTNDGSVVWTCRKATVNITNAVGTPICRTLTFRGDADPVGTTDFFGTLGGSGGVSINGSLILGIPTSQTITYTGPMTLNGSAQSHLILHNNQTIGFPMVFTLGADTAKYTIPTYFQTTPTNIITINRGVVEFNGVKSTPSINTSVYYNASIGSLVTSSATIRNIKFDNLELIGGGATSGTNWNCWDSTTATSTTLFLSTPTGRPTWEASTYYADGTVVVPTSPNNFYYVVITGGTSGTSEPSPWPTIIGDTYNDNGIIWKCIPINTSPAIYVGGNTTPSAGYKSVKGNTTYTIPVDITFYDNAQAVGFCSGATKANNLYFASTNLSLTPIISVYNGSILTGNLSFVSSVGDTIGDWDQSFITSSAGTITIGGTLTLSPSMSISDPQALIFNGTGTNTIVTNGFTYTKSITISVGAGTFNIPNNFELPSPAALSYTSGTLNFLGNAKLNSFTPSTASAKVLNFVLGKTIEMTGVGTPWNFATITGLTTTNLDKITIKFTNTSSSAITFAGGGLSYGMVWFNRNAATATGGISITGANTYKVFRDGNMYDQFGSQLLTPPARTITTYYNFGDTIKVGSFNYKVIVEGTTSSTPTTSLSWPTVIDVTLVDGGVTWACTTDDVYYPNIPAHSISFSVSTTQTISQNFLVSGQNLKLITLDNTGITSALYTLNNTSSPSVQYICYYLTINYSNGQFYDPFNPDVYEWVAKSSTKNTSTVGWNIVDERFFKCNIETSLGSGIYSWSEVNNWYLTDNALTPGGGLPAATTTVWFTALSGTGQVSITGTNKTINNLYCDDPTGATSYGAFGGTFVGALNVNNYLITTGNVKLVSGLINPTTGFNSIFWFRSSNGGTSFINMNGAELRAGCLIGSTSNQTVKLLSVFKTLGTIEHYRGTFDTSPNGNPLNGFDVYCNKLEASNFDGTITLNNSKVYLSGTANVWDVRNANLIINAGTSEIIINNTSNTTINFFAGTGNTYYDITFARTIASTGTNRIYLDGTSSIFNPLYINTLTDENNGAHSLLFQRGCIFYIYDLNVNGSAGNIVTMNGTDNSTYWFLFSTNPLKTFCDYVYVIYSDALISPYKYYTGVGGTIDPVFTFGWNMIDGLERSALAALGVGG